MNGVEGGALGVEKLNSADTDSRNTKEGLDLDHWMRAPPQPWSAAIEATMFTG
jgi:hypothetical protein